MPKKLSLLLLGLCLAACGSYPAARATEPGMAEAPKAGLIEADGTIRHIPLEGGFWAIVADDGRRFNPLELEARFQQEGLRVRFQAMPEPDVMSTRMWGEIITLQRIETLPPVD